jgi:hypothetical protein
MCPLISSKELKDFGRLAGGQVAYCDLDKNRKGRGYEVSIILNFRLDVVLNDLGSLSIYRRKMQPVLSGSSTELGCGVTL